MTTNILFVCMGNICRSPMAKIIMQTIVDKNNLTDKFFIDSCGIIDYHAGEQIDPRMREYAERRGYTIAHTAKQIDPDIHFEKFDYILAMDDGNLNDLYEFDKKKAYRDKIEKITAYASDSTINEVPDPYHADEKGFELVIDILEDCCQNLLNKLKSAETLRV